jgi:hypothetical protein
MEMAVRFDDWVGEQMGLWLNVAWPEFVCFVPFGRSALLFNFLFCTISLITRFSVAACFLVVFLVDMIHLHGMERYGGGADCLHCAWRWCCLLRGFDLAGRKREAISWMRFVASTKSVRA